MKLPVETVNRLRTFYEGKSVLVTGGAGFIGGHLCDALLSLGASITVLDDLSNSLLDHLSGLIELEPERVRFVHGSILDDEAVHDAFGGRVADSSGVALPGGSMIMNPDSGRFEPPVVVFHLAAVGSVQRSIENPQRSFAVNATGTLRVLEAARTHGVSRVVFAASSSAYGDPPGPPSPKIETMSPAPRSPYAASKLAGENLLSAYAHSYAMSTASLRFFNVFGPRQPADSDYAAVIPAFARRLLIGEAPRIFGDGSQSRDFTHVGNACLAMLLAGASRTFLRGEVVNVGAGRRTTVLELATMMAEIIAKESSMSGSAAVMPIAPHIEPARSGDVKHSLADLTRARELLGYVPSTSLEEGLAETIEWHRRSMAGA
jgi:nucleoside-diphosphate-sugar epimerase